MSEVNGDGWDEYRLFIVKKIKELSQQLAELDTKLDGVQSAVAALNVKAGVWGVLGGCAAVLTIWALSRLS